jgi:hypothetical protein
MEDWKDEGKRSTHYSNIPSLQYSAVVNNGMRKERI